MGDAPPKLKLVEEAEEWPKPPNAGACCGWLVPNAGAAGDCVPNPGAPPACWAWGAPKLKPAPGPALPPKGAGCEVCCGFAWPNAPVELVAPTPPAANEKPLLPAVVVAAAAPKLKPAVGAVAEEPPKLNPELAEVVEAPNGNAPPDTVEAGVWPKLKEALGVAVAP